MPKNLKGGKQFKRKAKEGDVDLSAFTIDRQEGQQIARAIKLLGNRNILCYCNDNKVRVCHICGKMRGRVFVDVGDIVLVSLREFELGSNKSADDLNGDILAKYPYECLTRLKKEIGINPKLFMQLETLDGVRLKAIGEAAANTIEDTEAGFDFDRDEANTEESESESELDIDKI
jgi:translation initiation factor 1A